MPRGIQRPVESTPAHDRIKGFKAAIRKLELEKRKIDLEIQKYQLEIEAVEEDLKHEQQVTSNPSEK